MYKWSRRLEELPDQLLILNFTLHLIKALVEEMSRTLESVGLSNVDSDLLKLYPRSLLETRRDHSDHSQLSQLIVDENLPKLNRDQRMFFDEVTSLLETNAMEEHRQILTFLDGPGGTGKTFLLNTIIHAFLSQRKVVVAVSSAGVSALLLHNGSTAHSAFGIPLNIDATSMCALSGKDSKSLLLQTTDLLIWDEIAMQHKHCVEAVDRSLQHIRQSDLPFGGLPVIFAGDF